MKLKLLTSAIIAINILLLQQEVPSSIIGLILASLALAFIVHGNKLRTFIKLSLLIASMALLRYNFKTLLVTECAVSFALILSSLKFWELNEERDHFNMFLILALCECCVFLLNPTFMIFLFGLLTMLFYFYYILKIRNYDVALLNTKRLLLLITPSIFVSLLLFYTFPRFTQGFITSSEMKYIIGGNSKLDFKQLGPLSTSNEVAFKVRGLENSNLPFKILYWRSNVLWQVVGDEWLPSNNNLKLMSEVIVSGKFKYDVEVYQNFKEYLPTLDGTSSITYSSLNFNPYSDGSFRLKSVTKSPLTYTVLGNYGDRQKTINNLMITKGLKLKNKNYERIKTAYFKNAQNSPSDEARLKELIQIFKKKSFQYSLSPPMYSSVEDFLLNGIQGYCSHFAAAFTYLSRLYNLPARMVVGYLGGEYNPYDNSVLVKELDAHAWVEVYIQSKGWIKVDPTALIVPLRPALGTEEFNRTLNPYIDIFNYKISREYFSFSTLNDLSLWADSLNSKFNSNLFNFDREKQLNTLRALTPKNLSVGWLFAISLTFSLVIFWLIFYFFGKKKIHPAEKRYRYFLVKMADLGIIKQRYETVSNFKHRCLEVVPKEANYIESEVGHYIDSFYK
jgi:transglutaminase-like putative cysteine protease